VGVTTSVTVTVRVPAVAMTMTCCVRLAVPVTCHHFSLAQTQAVFHVLPKNTSVCPRPAAAIARQKILSTLGHV
jgi:hypothetical protein